MSVAVTSSPGLVSAVYAGTLRHDRRIDSERRFEHPVNYAYLDLDELDTLAGGRLVRRTPGPWRFRRRDYLAPTDVPLTSAVRDRVHAATGERPDGPVRMLTQLRCFGMAFNPVTLYYCFTGGEESLHSVVADVTNTPWRERHAYVLGPWDRADGPSPNGEPITILHANRRKEMHVSPFLGMDQRYDISLTPPGAGLRVYIACVGPRQKEFQATLALERQADLDSTGLSRLIRTEPVAPLRTLARIYAQGFKLHRGGVAVRPHPTRGHT